MRKYMSHGTKYVIKIREITQKFKIKNELIISMQSRINTGNRENQEK